MAQCFGSVPARPLQCENVANSFVRLSIDSCSSDNDLVQIDWSLGVVWIHEVRVLALDRHSLLGGDVDNIISARFAGPTLRISGECFYNLSVLAAKMGMDAGDLEAKLRSE